MFSFISFQLFSVFFFFNDTATTEIYTLSLHDALPICPLFFRECHSAIYKIIALRSLQPRYFLAMINGDAHVAPPSIRSEEHTSELQSQSNLVCRLLLEKKKKKQTATTTTPTTPRLAPT